MTFKKALNLIILLTLSNVCFAAKKPKITWIPDYTVPTIEEKWKTENKPVTNSNRKLASSQSYSESDLSNDFKTLREQWLKVKDPDQLENLLKISYARYDNYSDDTKYFLAQAHLILPLRGIIWRMRPLFEKGGSFIGVKSTHVTAVQLLRSVA